MRNEIRYMQENEFESIVCKNSMQFVWALSYYSDLTLSQSFQPMVAQLSKKAALPLAKILATVMSQLWDTALGHNVWTLYGNSLYDDIAPICAQWP